jgi:hypothetical protein
MRKLYIILLGLTFSNLLFANNRTLEAARKAYANHQIEKAIGLYSQVSKESPYWGTALEEKAWAHLKLNQTSQVLALTKTLHSFPLNQLGYYESYVIQGLAELRTCRYSDVFKTIENFKTHKSERIKKLENLADDQTASTLAKTIVDSQNLKDFQADTPELAYLDKKLISAMKSKNTEQVQKRLQILAQDELKEIEKVVTQLKLIEVEAEQRVVRDAQNGFQTKSQGTFKKTNYNELIFPADDDPWIDELGQFEIAMQACLKQRRKL